MGINVSRLDKNYNFEVNSASYIGKPINNSVMYVSAKVGKLIENLEKAENCLVFAEETIDVPEYLKEKNCFVMVKNPQFAYAEFVQELADIEEERNKARKYTLTDGGYFLGENVSIGKNAWIEPGCLIGHDVRIGNNCKIFAGAKIKRSIIGDNFIANENCTIGAVGFTMADDINGNKIRIPTIGGVEIGDNVEIGTVTNVSAGSGGNTVIEDNVKIDTLVHIGHDAILKKNVEVVANVVVGGFATVGENVFVGMNVALRNRITIGDNSTVGMGAVVTKNVEPGKVMIGNPAKPLEKK